MSQDATRRSTRNQSHAASRSWQPPFNPESEPESGRLSIESYADRLMDDLFQDVEQALNFGLELAEPKPTKRRSLAVVPEPLPTPIPGRARVALSDAPRGNLLPLPVAPPAESLSERPSESLTESLPEQAADPSIDDTPPAPAPEKPRRPYDRILFGISCISIIVSLAIWLLNQEWKRQSATTPAPVPSPIAPSPPVSSDSSQFAEYAQQALQAIGQRTPAQVPSIAPAPSSTLPNPTLPTVTVPATPVSPIAPPPFRATGRLKMPVSPLPPNVLPSPTAIAPMPAVVPAPVPVNPPVPFTAPGLTRKLTGIVDMGDERSAVLIEINGVVQRFRLGESLGSSGWTLVEVSQNQAVIRRNGEVRSIFIGQSF
jgi:hypothetical protein